MEIVFSNSFGNLSLPEWVIQVHMCPDRVNIFFTRTAPLSLSFISLDFCRFRRKIHTSIQISNRNGYSMRTRRRSAPFPPLKASAHIYTHLTNKRTLDCESPHSREQSWPLFVRVALADKTIVGHKLWHWNLLHCRETRRHGKGTEAHPGACALITL